MLKGKPGGSPRAWGCPRNDLLCLQRPSPVFVKDSWLGQCAKAIAPRTRGAC